MSLAMAGSASAAVVNGEKRSSQPLLPVFTLGDEELSDISLSKIFVYDRESHRGIAARRAVRPKEIFAVAAGVRRLRRCGGGGCAVTRWAGSAAVAAEAAPLSADALAVQWWPPAPPGLQLLPVVGRLPAMLNARAFRSR